jgi:thiamine biosynthesis lipoprotein
MLMENRLAAQTTHDAMGTIMTHKAFGEHAEECLAAVREEVDRLEKTLSRFLPESDISRINRSAGIQCENVSFDTCEVLSQAVEFSRKCQGCFDVTIGPLVSLWAGYRNASIAPDDASIRRVLPLVNYHELIVDPWKMTAGLRKVGQSIDLGGIGKGFAGDRILEVYQDYGITSAYSNLGGNVVTLGTKPDGSPWHVGIQHPRQEKRLIGSVSVIGQSVVTSGDYQRYFTDRQGKRHHHILNPYTGYPAGSGLISVSIVTENSLAADALSTILFVSGIEEGHEILRSIPHSEAILVTSDLQIYVTKGLRTRFQADEGIEVIFLD